VVLWQKPARERVIKLNNSYELTISP